MGICAQNIIVTRIAKVFEIDVRTVSIKLIFAFVGDPRLLPDTVSWYAARTNAPPHM
jgi:hypothetical protein